MIVDVGVKANSERADQFHATELVMQWAKSGTYGGPTTWQDAPDEKVKDSMCLWEKLQFELGQRNSRIYPGSVEVFRMGDALSDNKDTQRIRRSSWGCQ